MRYIALTEAKAGMQLATSLYDSNGRTLVGSHILLTDNYIEKLIEYGYAGIYIEDELTQDIEVEDAISPQLRAEGMDCIEKRDIDGCKVVAEKLVEEILSKGRISLDMLDLRSYDDYTYAHSVNVGVLCGVIGMEMHMNEKEMAQLVTAALLHDLGKLAIPGEILNKPGRLTQKEYKRMQEHRSFPMNSSRIVLTFLHRSRWRFSFTMKMSMGQAILMVSWVRSRLFLPRSYMRQMSMMRWFPSVLTKSLMRRVKRQSISWAVAGSFLTGRLLRSCCVPSLFIQRAPRWNCPMAGSV